jgi:hypothetical protein
MVRKGLDCEKKTPCVNCSANETVMKSVAWIRLVKTKNPRSANETVMKFATWIRQVKTRNASACATVNGKMCRIATALHFL